LRTKFNLDMNIVYKFELQELQLMDVESETAESLDNETD
jgi:hypothetical protein